MEVKHPLEEGLKGIYGVIFSDDPKEKDATLRNVTIFADGQVDRSPCGTGTSARIATLFEKATLQKGEVFIHECITDGKFQGEVLSVTAVDTYEAVVPKVTGNAFITGFHQFVVDPRDDLNRGFLLG
jgi:proline racemase/trans-L-3-hydroxyproline dehydratase